MKKRVTIQDIATEAGVSVGSVHRTVYGKKGVSEKQRKKILEICALRGYRVNLAASALKRGTVRIVAAFPRPEGEGRYFFSRIWMGFRRSIAEFRDFKLDVVELFYDADCGGSQAIELKECFRRYGGEIDALITVGHFDDLCKKVVAAYRAQEIPIFLVCDDAGESGRVACVQANYEVTGAMVAELLSSQLSSGDAILLCAGDVLIPSHSKTVQKFAEYMETDNSGIEVIKLYGYRNENDFCRRLGELLESRKDIRGAFSVSARLSVLLADAVSERKLTERIRVIASDLFEENAHNLEWGIIKNIVHKNPEQQAYLAAKLMGDYVLKAQKPVEDVQYVESCIVFRSSLSLFPT